MLIATRMEPLCVVPIFIMSSAPETNKISMHVQAEKALNGQKVGSTMMRDLAGRGTVTRLSV